MAEDLKDRVEKVDDRIRVLVKKYPLVPAAVFLAGAIVGFGVGLWVS